MILGFTKVLKLETVNGQYAAYGIHPKDSNGKCIFEGEPTVEFRPLLGMAVVEYEDFWTEELLEMIISVVSVGSYGLTCAEDASNFLCIVG